MIEGVDYCFVNSKDDAQLVNIRLLEGPYKGTLFRYGKVKIKEEGGVAHLLFAYDVLESEAMKPKKLEKDETFKNYIGDLLVEIMTANMDQDIKDEIGTDDS